jgi:hypothetical protein
MEVKDCYEFRVREREKRDGVDLMEQQQWGYRSRTMLWTEDNPSREHKYCCISIFDGIGFRMHVDPRVKTEFAADFFGD